MAIRTISRSRQLGQNLTHVRTGSKEEERFDHSVNTYEHLGTSRPATMESDLQARGRFGLQVDQMKATFDNLVIRRLDIDTLNVEGLPDSIEQLSVLPEMESLRRAPMARPSQWTGRTQRSIPATRPCCASWRMAPSAP